MLAIELRRLQKHFRGQIALDNIDLHITSGQTTVIVGESGAGKSTLLRVVAGLEMPDRGSVCIAGQDVTGSQPHQRGIAYLTQDYALYPQQTVQQNLQTSLHTLRLPPAELTSRITTALESLKIEDLAQRLPSQLSGGQRQRVALARVVARRPQILLLDEPFSQLDASLKSQLRSLLSELPKSMELTVVMVSHDPIDSLLLADEMVVMQAGRIRQTGTPEEIYQHPVDQSTAELLSPLGVNWLAANAIANVCQLPQGISQVGFRPEAAILQGTSGESPATESSQAAAAPISSSQASKGEICLRVSIEAIQSIGFSQVAVCRLAGTRLNVLLANHQLAPPPGTTAELTIERNNLMLCEPSRMQISCLA